MRAERLKQQSRSPLSAAPCCCQGEQNGGNPGNYLNKSGYACLLPALDDAWRGAFRKGSSTNPNFPIGPLNEPLYLATHLAAIRETDLHTYSSAQASYRCMVGVARKRRSAR